MWTNKQQERALAQGWGLFAIDGSATNVVIQKNDADPEHVFKSDDEAEQYVRNAWDKLARAAVRHLATLPKAITWGLTLEQAKALRPGTTLNYRLGGTNSDGSLARYKVTSVQKWKTRPEQVLITAKFGYKNDYRRYDEANLEDLRVGTWTSEWEAK